VNYANVVSTLALFLALGGAGALAAGKLGPKSVGETQLRPGAVTALKLRKNAVSPPKIQAFAVKGGKIAGGAVTATKLASGAVSGEKLTSGAVTGEKLAPGAVSGEKVDEASLSQVPSAAKADFADLAGSANPEAFAAVDQEGNVDPALSKGIAGGNVKLGSEPGIYCVSVPRFDPRGAQATLAYNGSGSVNIFVKLGGSAGCASPNVQVQTFSSGTRAKEPFYIVFYR
jgi:hypothetical protein